MKKQKAVSVFVCQECGYESSKWLGKCPACHNWNTFVEEKLSTVRGASRERQDTTQPVALNEVATATRLQRLPTGIGELDRVLGGGIVPASVVLLAGEPGIGKSTLLLQMALALHRQEVPVMYVSGEEALEQIAARASRLGGATSALPVLADTLLENIVHHIEAQQPRVVIIDSVQAIFSEAVQGAPGNVSQVREVASQLFRLAKEKQLAVFLVGHVTKEGFVAGPKLLEHLVDVVIYFEQTAVQHRLIRAVKNRFGAAGEIGVFEMTASGLVEIQELSRLFLTGSHQQLPGSAIAAIYEGTRSVLVEVQALVSRSNYGTPQRTVSGMDYRRLALLLAVLEKFVQVDFGIYDVFVKVAGGLRVDDPALDLAAAAAIFSSRTGTVLPAERVWIGELGLSGEIRPVPYLESRLKEVAKMGFKEVVLPKQNVQQYQAEKKAELNWYPVERIEKLFQK